MTQLSLDDGVQGKTAGLDAVESSDSRFVSLMRTRAKEISERLGFVSSDDLRVIAARMDLKPHHPNVWGAIFRGPHWEIIERKKSALPSNHSRELKVWRYVP